MSCERVTRLPRRIQQKRERNHPGSSDLFNTAASGGGVWGGTAVQVLGSGWLQPVESDNIAFLLMPHCRPSPRTRAGGYIFPVPRNEIVIIIEIIKSRILAFSPTRPIPR